MSTLPYRVSASPSRLPRCIHSHPAPIIATIAATSMTRFAVLDSRMLFMMLLRYRADKWRTRRAHRYGGGPHRPPAWIERQSVGTGKRGAVRVDLGGGRLIKQKNQKERH